MSLTHLKYLKFKIFVKLIIQIYQFIGITLSKSHLVCTFFDKQINAKKYEWKFGSVQVLLVGDCITQNNLWEQPPRPAYKSLATLLYNRAPFGTFLDPLVRKNLPKEMNCVSQ